jgi:hypothetical protein
LHNSHIMRNCCNSTFYATPYTYNPWPLKKEKQLILDYTKTQIADAIAEETGLTRADVNRVIDALADVIKLHINKTIRR